MRGKETNEAIWNQMESIITLYTARGETRTCIINTFADVRRVKRYQSDREAVKSGVCVA